MSSGEPVLVMTPDSLRGAGYKSPWAALGDLEPLSVGFCKGQARINTLQVILSICMDHGIQLNEDCVGLTALYGLCRVLLPQDGNKQG